MAKAGKKPERGWKAAFMRKGIQDHPTATARELADLLTKQAKEAGFNTRISPQEIYGARSEKKAKRKGKRRGRPPEVPSQTVAGNGQSVPRPLGRPAAESLRPQPSVSEAIDHLQAAIKELGSAGVRKIMDLIGK